MRSKCNDDTPSKFQEAEISIFTYLFTITKEPNQKNNERKNNGY